MRAFFPVALALGIAAFAACAWNRDRHVVSSTSTSTSTGATTSSSTASEETMRPQGTETRALPPIDLVATPGVETATFAVG